MSLESSEAAMAKFLLCFAVLILVLIQVAVSDINIFNPRGSNNRLSETSRNRQNANRMFDSQNNDRGGYNVGQPPNAMSYYGGSKLRIQWVVQHSCGDENANCDVIMQYMCGENVRDGKMRRIIPLIKKDCNNDNCDSDTRFGQHENMQYYRECVYRERNYGLFTANEKPRTSGRSTRQNKAGTRSGLECPEERDYYPYWWPSPWKDIAIFTSDVSRCKKNVAPQSQNVQGKYYCYLPEEYWENKDDEDVVLFLTKKKCENNVVFDTKGRPYWPEWRLKRSHGLEEPECLKSPWSRDNHQGNGIDGQFMHYDWTVPDINAEHCVVRIRYNVSTNDYPQYDIDSKSNGFPGPAIIWQRFNMDPGDAEKRHFVFKNNPSVDVFNSNTKDFPNAFRLRLAINQAKYGRTFQDRTHVFKIRQRPEELEGKTIVNVNVRGKRGNVVQVYPSVPYDFVPNKLLITSDDYVHFQWTGSDLNNPMNDGHGKKSTDRNNIVQLADKKFSKWTQSNETFATNYPVEISDLMGLHWKDINKLSHLTPCEGSDPLLNSKSAYFNMEPVQPAKIGTFYYMSSRNNRFGHQTQKASIQVGHSCYDGSDRGNSYRGFVAESKSGKPCLSWGEERKFPKYYNPRRFPFDGLDSNYCRNPDRTSRNEPWCYVAGFIWEYCDITSCRALKRRNENMKIMRDEPEIPDNVIEERNNLEKYDTDYDKTSSDDPNIYQHYYRYNDK